MPETDPQVTPAPAVAPAAPPPAAPQKLDLTSAQLDERLTRAQESAQRKLLADLGVDDIGKAKAALAAAKAAEEANKTAEQKAAELSAKLMANEAETSKLRSAATEYAARMMVGLTPEQQAAVKAIAGDDAATQLRTIGALAPTWAAAQSAAQPAPAPAAPQPATTAPAPTAPASVVAGSPPDHRSVYSQLKASNPFAAAAYGSDHPEVFDSKR